MTHILSILQKRKVQNRNGSEYREESKRKEQALDSEKGRFVIEV
jgi:hypothetical protein